METVTILRELWRLRLLVAVAALLAILAGSFVAFRLPSLESRKYEVGVATARILVDTPNSQVVEVSPKGSDMLGVRANLLANLMVEGEIKTAIAAKIGLAPEDLRGLGELGAEPADAAKPADGKAHVLTTRVLTNPDGDRLPVIEIEAQGPDKAHAAQLADAAVTGLREYLDTKAATQQISDARRLRVSGLGAAQARDVIRGPRMTTAIAAGIFVFAAFCVLILLVFAMIRGWQTLAIEEYSQRVSRSPDPSRIDELFVDHQRPAVADDIHEVEDPSAPLWGDVRARAR